MAVDIIDDFLLDCTSVVGKLGVANFFFSFSDPGFIPPGRGVTLNYARAARQSEWVK